MQGLLLLILACIRLLILACLHWAGWTLTAGRQPLLQRGCSAGWVGCITQPRCAASHTVTCISVAAWVGRQGWAATSATSTALLLAVPHHSAAAAAGKAREAFEAGAHRHGFTFTHLPKVAGDAAARDQLRNAGAQTDLPVII